MGIQQLADSFENLENLQKLSLQGNQLREVTSVKLPMATLETLDVNQCNLRLISPFVVSMLEEKNKNAKLRIYARGNLNVSVIDIRKTLKAIKGLSLDLSNFDNTLIEIANRSSRLRCIEEPLDPYIVESKTDDLYNGSESSLDQESGGTKKKEETFKNGGWIFICYVQLTSNCGDNLHSSTSGLIIVVQLQLYSFIFILLFVPIPIYH